MAGFSGKRLTFFSETQPTTYASHHNDFIVGVQGQVGLSENFLKVAFIYDEKQEIIIDLLECNKLTGYMWFTHIKECSLKRTIRFN